MKLRIDKAIYGGAGLGRVSDEGDALCGKTVFVPFTLPGETVELHITQDKRSYANGELDTVLEASEMRVTPLCRYFGACGGCQYQHAEYAGQLEMKRAILRETLDRARLKDLPEITVIANEPWAYRNRIRLLVETQPKFSLGYRRRNSHASVSISECPIASPLLQRAIAAVTENGEAAGLGAICQEVEFFANGAEDSLLMAMHSVQSPRNAAALLETACDVLARALPELKGAALFAHGDEENHGQVLARWGEPSLVYRVAGFDYRVSLGSFFQVNRLLVEQLLTVVLEGRSGTLAWDLYAGVGLFARALTANFKQVVAVEAAPFSAGDLEENLKDTSHVSLRRATRDFLRDQVRGKGARPGLVVVDPPRSGLGDEVCALLAKVAAPEIVYVSCDPATLSRDVNTLVQSGYRLRQIYLVDMFPQTFHMESVAVLSRS